MKVFFIKLFLILVIPDEVVLALSSNKFLQELRIAGNRVGLCLVLYIILHIFKIIMV
jgi:hypothetical protein